jgi:DNA mismatch endonuclease (patch repair protein)
MDVVDRATRSRMMSGIRGKNTKPELVVRSYLHRSGLRFRLHSKLPGKPDLVLPKYRTTVFVHGCFWHRHKGCRFTTTPASNSALWQDKFASNVRRDAKATAQLEKLGWRVLVIWACQLNESSLKRLAREIRKGK